MPEHYVAFGDRLRQIRKDMGMSQDEFAKILGTSKQALSRYENLQHSPKVSMVQEYAKKLNVSIDYMLGDSEAESTYAALDLQTKGKPFYKIFLDITEAMGLDIPGIVCATGLTDRQVRTIITRRMKDAPLPLALRLSDTLGVALKVWTGDMNYAPTEFSVEAREVAFAYEKASVKDKNMARVALDLPPVGGGA